jgi:hypothetical protein
MSRDIVVAECLSGIKEIIDCYIEFIDLPIGGKQRDEMDKVWVQMMNPIIVKSVTEELYNFRYSIMDDPFEVISKLMDKTSIRHFLQKDMVAIKLVLNQALSIPLFREPAQLVLSKFFIHNRELN